MRSRNGGGEIRRLAGVFVRVSGGYPGVTDDAKVRGGSPVVRKSPGVGGGGYSASAFVSSVV